MPGHSPLITAAQLADSLGCDDLCVIDCRFDLLEPGAGRRAWLDGHIPGAVYADLDRDLAGPISASSGRHPLPEVSQFTERLGNWGVGNDSEVVVYDAGSGAIAARAWWMMHWLGHDSVRLLDGGIKAWLDAGHALDNVPAARPASRFVAWPRDDMIVTTAEVEAAVVSGDEMTLLDARDATRFRGEAEPIDRVAGHIPGTVNLPFAGSLTDEGRFRPAAEIARRFDEALQPLAGRRWGVRSDRMPSCAGGHVRRAGNARPVRRLLERVDCGSAPAGRMRSLRPRRAARDCGIDVNLMQDRRVVLINY